MEQSQRKRLDGWLRKQLWGTDTKVTKLTIRHLNGKGSTGAEVDSIKVDEDPKPEELDDLINTIEQAYVCDAEGLGDHQKYVIHAHFSDGETRRFVVTWQAEGDEYGEALDSEGANPKGMLSQMMRHNEVLMKISTMSTGQTIAMQNRTIARLSEENEKLHEQVLAHSALMEDLRTQKHIRDLETFNSQTKAEIIRDFGGKISNLLPVVVNRLAKGQLMPMKSTPKEEMLKTFITSLKPEQLAQIGSQLSPEQQILVYELVGSVADEKIKEDEKKQSNGLTTGVPS